MSFEIKQEKEKNIAIFCEKEEFVSHRDEEKELLQEENAKLTKQVQELEKKLVLSEAEV